MKNAVIFGGTGFIGRHTASYLLSKYPGILVYLVDIKPLDGYIPENVREGIGVDQIKYVELDVRHSIQHSNLPSSADLIFNFAAVHREPGHTPNEYFETNILGAENICSWADMVDGKRIIFISSISTYGPTEDRKSESSLPTPISPYGSSKLVAEKIHIGWTRDDAEKWLLILRPGVVFGPGEGGNVTRMLKAVKHHYFAYLGNKDTRKANIYVKELINIIFALLEDSESRSQQVILSNGVMNYPPTMQEFVQAIEKADNRKYFVPTVPYPIILCISYWLEFLLGLVGKKGPISPVRVRKLRKSNNIISEYLPAIGYTYRYSLEDAFSDWRNDNPDDWK